MDAHPLVLIARYGLIGVIWTGQMLMVVALAQSESLTNNGVAFVVASVIGATIVSLALLRARGALPPAGQYVDDARKRKNDGRGIDPASLLTDDDIAELRDEYKDMLRRQMLQDASEPASFESLLSDREQRRRS